MKRRSHSPTDTAVTRADLGPEAPLSSTRVSCHGLGYLQP